MTDAEAPRNDRDLCDLGCGIVHSLKCEVVNNRSGLRCGRAFHHPGDHEDSMPDNFPVDRDAQGHAVNGLRKDAANTNPGSRE